MADKARFEASTHQGVITISRVHKDQPLEMYPADVGKATHLVGLVLSMVELPVIPNPIKNTPFVIRVFPEQKFALERTDRGGSIPFRTCEGEELIEVIEMGLGMCLNEQIHGKIVPKVQ
jgi:hypothetical protein